MKYREKRKNSKKMLDRAGPFAYNIGCRKAEGNADRPLHMGVPLKIVVCAVFVSGMIRRSFGRSVSNQEKN